MLFVIKHLEFFIKIFKPEKIVILDPKAVEKLKPEDIEGKAAFKNRRSLLADSFVGY